MSLSGVQERIIYQKQNVNRMGLFFSVFWGIFSSDGGAIVLVCRMFKISNTFLVLFSNKIIAIRAGIHIMLVRIANTEGPDQTASLEVV